MTETRPDPKNFHEADYNDYVAMLDGLAQAIWNELRGHFKTTLSALESR
ncbi:hypothetical protein [Paracoccus fontiphilus]|uniref:Uncharacterized protein n=1 Tax=Paracoccus fontiphilus TaxID=1815556 RepID=A0ABV7IIK1_9RHOB|nr:hypothetical protein [Paracoccus fontiphilus]